MCNCYTVTLLQRHRPLPMVQVTTEGTTMGLIEDAKARSDARLSATPRIDYERMNKLWPKQKAALTRAKKTGDPEKVAAVCKKAVAEWNEIGAWPDDWSLFQRTLDDVLPWHSHVDIADL